MNSFKDLKSKIKDTLYGITVFGLLSWYKVVNSQNKYFTLFGKIFIYIPWVIIAYSVTSVLFFAVNVLFSPVLVFLMVGAIIYYMGKLFFRKAPYITVYEAERGLFMNKEKIKQLIDSGVSVKNIERDYGVRLIAKKIKDPNW